MPSTASEQQRIGRYEILDVLGSGSAGIVYRAKDPLIGREVAIKTLHATRALSPDQWRVVHERFMREAQTAGSLDHPNIVKIFDVGKDPITGELYIVMEYVHGRSLERTLSARLSPEQLVGMLEQLASALDAAHSGGIVHRDIKPGNILLAGAGVVKVTDFGIARITTSHLTQDVSALGTPRYMSPEQVEGKDLDGRADLFSMGVICYQLLTGRQPFEADNTFSLAYQIVHNEPLSPSTLEPELSTDVDRIMARILAKDPAQRYRSGLDFVADLRRALLPGRPAAVPATGAPEADAPVEEAARSRRGPWIGLAALVAIGAASAVWWARDRGQPDTDVRGSVPAGTEVVESLPDDGAPADVLTADATAAGAVEEPATAAAPAPSMLQVRLMHWTSEGTLVVTVDGRPVVHRAFSKGFSPIGSSEFEPVEVPSGRHPLRARVVGARGKIFDLEPQTIELGPGTTVLRLHLRQRLTVRSIEPASR